VGCKIYIRRQGPEGEPEERLAEILSIRDKPTSAYAQRTRSRSLTAKAEDATTNEGAPEDKWEFFVHWESFNKRLDEWVPGSRLVLSRDLQWPRPKPPPGKKTTGKAQHLKAPGKAPRSKSLLKKATAGAAAAAAASPTPTPQTPVPDSGVSSPGPSSSLKRKAPHDEEEEEEEEPPEPELEPEPELMDDEDPDAEGEMDVDAEGEADTFEEGVAAVLAEQRAPAPVFSKEQEIEKLRTSGSMTQSISEIARVKNLNRLQIGRHEVDAWYFSPYPKEYAHLPVLYICEFCLAFFPSQMMLLRHRTRCNLLHPPGNEIYRHEDISFFEIDGKRQLAWCRNLSLLSKCFLDQ
jgi:histone acetyltransferase HTATIP